MHGGSGLKGIRSAKGQDKRIWSACFLDLRLMHIGIMVVVGWLVVWLVGWLVGCCWLLICWLLVCWSVVGLLLVLGGWWVGFGL